MHTEKLHDFLFKQLHGETLQMASLKGQSVLMINTASLCGFAGQIREIPELLTACESIKLTVVCVPSYDFGKQEYTDVKDIVCPISNPTTCMMTEPCSVIGPNAHPCYQWIYQQCPWYAKPKWNFHKFLFDPQGNYVDWFSSSTSLRSKKIIQAIIKTQAR